MGSYASKLFSHNSEHNSKSKTQPPVSSNASLEKIKMCTPPISKRKLAADPRSATLGLTRTPIEIACTPPGLTRRVASALPKYLQGKRYLETDFDAVTPVTTPVKCIPDPRSPNTTEQRTPIVVKSGPGYLTPVVTVNQAPDMETPVRCPRAMTLADPRSPATDFDRTPILKPRSVERIVPDTEENILDTAENDACGSRLSYCETTTDYSIPEIQAISEIIPVADESLSLENRLDVCEGTVNSLSSRSSSIGDESAESDSEEQVTVIRNPKMLSPWSDAISTWTDKNVVVGTAEVSNENPKSDELLGNALDDKISDVINAVMKNSIGETKTIVANDKIKVWRDSVSPPNIPEENGRKNSEEIIIEFDDDYVEKSATKIDAIKTTNKLEDDKTKNQVKKRKPQQLQSKNENKPVLDERKVFNNEGKMPIDAAKNRTPLANRSNNHKQLQIIPGKSPQQLLRNKGLSTRTIQQENTPPHNDRFISKTKSNGSQWDPDSTVII